jgi:two-component system LytT family response regulator
VDDEEIAIHRMKKALSVYPHIKVVGEANDGIAAVRLINTLRPDLVFLDISMPAFNGFDVVDQLEYTPLIVFVTAYDEYAVKAFEKNSLDYLLKPVEEDRLANTIRRIEQNRHPEADWLIKIKTFISGQIPTAQISTIPVQSGDSIQLVHVGDIVFFEAKEKYVSVHTKNEEKFITYALTYLEDKLPGEFVRVHRSYIVNKMKIREIRKYFKGTFLLTMSDEKATKIKSSYSYSDVIKEKLLLI